jgi:hydroxypyruvate reductase
VRAAIAGVDAGRLLRDALGAPDVARRVRRAAHVDVIAAGKAAAPMLDALENTLEAPRRRTVGIGPAGAAPARAGEWIVGGHPLPDPGSVEAAERALVVARAAAQGDLLLVLLSGGGSALMALPAAGVTLDDKRATARALMDAGADIHELNTVRKHLSDIKGGQLALASVAEVLTLALSDVVGDDLSVIASGPTVPDDSTFADALAVLDRRGSPERYPPRVVARLRRGAGGQVPETPGRGDPRLARASARVIGRQRGALDGARAAAESIGYHVHVIPEPITGEARVAATAYAARVAALLPSLPRPACVLSSGETTVTVRGTGRGGRNQEFAFAMAQSLDRLGTSVAAASIGTDGIDGPTDAAGAVVDPATFARAREAGITAPQAFLDDNDTYTFFDRLGDLVRTGPTGTNVGDLQILLVGI